jgi:hypothetical protein
LGHVEGGGQAQVSQYLLSLCQKMLPIPKTSGSSEPHQPLQTSLTLSLIFLSLRTHTTCYLFCTSQLCSPINLALK